MENNELILAGQSELYALKMPETHEDKIELYNAIQNTDYALNECNGKVIEISNFICHPCRVTSQQTNEEVDAERVILVDVNGKSYSTISPTFKNAMVEIIAIFGLPSKWTAPLKIQVMKKKGKKGLEFLTAKVVK